MIAGVLPDGKEDGYPLRSKHRVRSAMVGDGINDAPALTSRRCGHRHRRRNETLQIDAADVVLMKSRL